MPLYGRQSMTNLPITLGPANGWACVLELDWLPAQSVSTMPMTDSDVRELIEMLEEALR